MRKPSIHDSKAYQFLLRAITWLLFLAIVGVVGFVVALVFKFFAYLWALM